LNFVCEELEGAALVGSGGESVFFKLNDWLEVESNGSDLWLEDPNKVGVVVFIKLITIGFEVMGVYVCSPIRLARKWWVKHSSNV
jgi:hypothetical protein